MKRNKALTTMRASGGRFFGLTTKQGEVINAQFLGETPCYVKVRDRNADIQRRFAKTSLSSVNLGGGRAG